MRLTALAVILLSTILSGCASLPGWGIAQIPDKPFESADIRAIASKYTNVSCSRVADGCSSGIYKDDSWLDKMQDCNAAPGDATCLQYRNAMISELVLVINHNHAIYEGNLLAGRAKADFYIGTGRSALETAATLIDPAGVKTVLSSLATLTGAIQDKSSEAFYYQQSAPALSQLMQAERSRIMAEIGIYRKQSYGDYTIADSVADLDRYYRAGTIATALAKMNQQAGQISAKAEDDLTCIRLKTTEAERKACLQ